MRRAIAIVRASTNDLKQANSHELQMNLINQFAHKHGYIIEKMFSSYVSGTKPLDERPVLKEAIAYAEENDCYVICYRLDRLSRNLGTFSAIESLLPRVRFATQGDQPVNLLLASMLLSIAHAESKANSQRVSSAYKTLKAKYGDNLRWGRKQWDQDTRGRAVSSIKSRAREHNDHIMGVVSDLKAAGYTTKEIVDRLKDLDLKTRRGYYYTYPNLLRVIRAYNQAQGVK